MSSKVMQIALRIGLIKEEFSESEIAAAVRLLEEQGTASAVLAHLAGRKAANHPTKKKRLRNSRTPLKDQKSRAILELQETDPEKYQLLSEFDSLLREGKILPELEDIKRLGEQISKDFAPRNSRRDVVNQLTSLMARRPVDEIRGFISKSLTSSHFDDKSNEYHELARFIIGGKSSEAKVP